MTTATDIDIVDQVQTYYKESRKAKRRRLDSWNRNFLAVNNRTLPVSMRPGWLPDSRASEIFPILAALVGWMTDQRIKIEVTPFAKPHSAFFDALRQMGADLEQVIESLWTTKNWDAEVEKMLWDAMVYGTGFLKAVWDPAEDKGKGNPKVIRVDPWAIFLDPAAARFDECSYVIETRRMSLDEIDRRFPGAKARLAESGGPTDIDEREDPYQLSRPPRANPGAMPSGGSGALGAGGTNTGGSRYGLPGQGRTRATQEPGYVVHEAWLRVNELYTDEQGVEYTQDRWRVVVTCGMELLMDEWAEDLWDYAKHPFQQYLIHDSGELWGMSLVEHLVPCQEAIVRLLAALQQHAELCGNPVLVDDIRSGIQRTQITNRPGQRLTKNTAAELEWLKPPDMPPGVFNLVQFWVSEMEKISGLSAVVRGFSPNNRAAQGVMDQVQESAFVRVRSGLRNLERTLSNIGEMLASLIVQNYTEPRVVAIVGPSGSQSSLFLQGHHFFSPADDGSGPMEYSLNVRAGSALPTSRQARAAEADQLYIIQGIDRQALLEAHDFPNWPEVLKRMSQLDQLGAANPQQVPARQAAHRSH